MPKQSPIKNEVWTHNNTGKEVFITRRNFDRGIIHFSFERDGDDYQMLLENFVERHCLKDNGGSKKKNGGSFPLDALREGKTIRRTRWSEDMFLQLENKHLFCNFSEDEALALGAILLEDLLAQDWEVVE